MNIDPIKFVDKWLNASNLEEVCKQFTITESKASSYAYALRKLGVKLPGMRRRVIIDAAKIDQLNQLIEKHQNGDSK